MNEYCKNYLKHSWGSSPERKELEKIYNAKYYQKNKHRWVINRQRRMGNVPASTLTSTTRPSGDTNDIIIAPFTLYDDTEDFNKSSKASFEVAKKFVKEFLAAPAAIIEGTKAVGRVLAKAPKAVIESGKKFVDALKKTKVVKFLKKSKEAYDKTTKSS